MEVYSIGRMEIIVLAVILAGLIALALAITMRKKNDE